MGFNEFIGKLFGNKQTRDIKEIQPWVEKGRSDALLCTADIHIEQITCIFDAEFSVQLLGKIFDKFSFARTGHTEKQQIHTGLITIC